MNIKFNIFSVLDQYSEFCWSRVHWNQKYPKVYDGCQCLF